MGGSLRRRGGVYWFRRRVPQGIVGKLGRDEVNRSLGTTCHKEAHVRARQVWLATEKVFEDVARRSLTEEQATLIISRLRTEPVWNSETIRELDELIKADDDAMADLRFRHAASLLPALTHDERLRILHVMERLADKVALREADRGAEIALVRAQVDELRLLTAQVSEAKAKASGRKLAAAVVSAERSLIVERRVAERLASEPRFPLSSGPAIPPLDLAVSPTVVIRSKARSPLLSSVQAAFLADKRQGTKGYTGQTAKQVEATFRLLNDLIGDKPITDYNGQDAGRFRDLLLRMPASHGKGGRMNAMDAIRKADEVEKKSGQHVARLTMKTAKGLS